MNQWNQFRKKQVTLIKTLSYLMAITILLICHGSKVNAATDKKKPTLTVTANTKEFAKNITLTIKATDASGIKEVKYVNSDQKTSYFKKGGTKLKLSKGKTTLTITENGVYTFYAKDKAGNTKIRRITIEQIDQTSPIISLSKSVMNQEGHITVDAFDFESDIKSVSYVYGDVEADDKAWEDSIDITGQSNFIVTETCDVTVKAIDLAGNEMIDKIHVEMELKAVWISYLEFSSNGYTKESFTTYVEEMFDHVLDLNMNAVIVQVRPFGDAIYPSKYYPWSKYVSGKQGSDPGFDPLTIMVDAAHERNLEFHAWINPYRITSGTTDIKSLSEDHPARKWLSDDDTSNDRNVLAYDKKLFFNPASSEVRKLIIDGVKEIVKNYDVDGIHFDDYFYPTLGKDYAKIFDAEEYNAYVNKQTNAGKTVKSIEDWRRGNVNTLVKSVYSSIKAIRPTVQFGISPHGNINNLRAKDRYYVDVDTWLSKAGYIDYICPQIYWTFENSVCPFDTVLDQWIELRTIPSVNVYVGIANYRAGSGLEDQWKETSILADMITYGRNTGQVDGYMFFRYAYFSNKTCLPAVNKLIPLLAN